MEDLKDEEIVRTFYKKSCKRQNRTLLGLKKY